MATPSDLTKTGIELVFDLINTDNSATLTNGAASATNMTLAAPTALTGDASGKNSSISISAVAGKGYTGAPVVVKYNRLDIAADVMAKLAPGGATIVDNSYATVADLVVALNAKYSINLQPVDISNGSTAISGAYPRSVEIDIAAGSYGYINKFTASVTQPDVALSAAIANTTLDGLNGPA